MTAHAAAPSSRPILLCGPPGAGKSTLGEMLARALGRPFFDSDREVERDAGHSIPELFRQEGEAGFRRRERLVLERLLAEPRGPVIATGGGALLETSFRRHVLQRTFVISLESSIDALLARVGAVAPDRPLLGDDARGRLQLLLAQREDAYAEAHACIRSEGSIDEVFARLQTITSALVQRAPLVVPLGKRSYCIHLAAREVLPELVTALAPSRQLWVLDAHVASAFEDVLAKMTPTPLRHVLRGRGERDKTLRTVQALWDAALSNTLDRQSMFIAVGGGVVTDLTGFAAATFLRGVRYASAPTTLLSMVDASVGGKTGFDAAQGKNLIGAFHHPSFVLCDVSVLQTLAARDLRAGLSEIVKIALVRDDDLLRQIEQSSDALSTCAIPALGALVRGAIQAKINVVAEDETEQGVRAHLNFGHTLGHAIETAAGYRLRHGECVAIGMRAALYIGERLGITPSLLVKDTLHLFDRLALPRALPRGLSIERVMAALRQDKKRAAGMVRFVLLTDRGSACVAPVSEEHIMTAISSLTSASMQPARRKGAA